MRNYQSQIGHRGHRTLAYSVLWRPDQGQGNTSQVLELDGTSVEIADGGRFYPNDDIDCSIEISAAPERTWLNNIAKNTGTVDVSASDTAGLI